MARWSNCGIESERLYGNIQQAWSGPGERRLVRAGRTRRPSSSLSVRAAAMFGKAACSADVWKACGSKPSCCVGREEAALRMEIARRSGTASSTCDCAESWCWPDGHPQARSRRILQNTLLVALPAALKGTTCAQSTAELPAR